MILVRLNFTALAHQALRRRAALEAKGQYLFELFEAGLHGEDLDYEATEWRMRLMELVGPHLGADEAIDCWYQLEDQRLLRWMR